MAVHGKTFTLTTDQATKILDSGLLTTWAVVRSMSGARLGGEDVLTSPGVTVGSTSIPLATLTGALYAIGLSDGATIEVLSGTLL